MTPAPTADTGPGFLAFVAFFLLALALWFLMRNMNARMRRMSYRQQAAHRGKDDPQADDGDGPVERGAPVDEARRPDAGRDRPRTTRADERCGDPSGRGRPPARPGVRSGGARAGQREGGRDEVRREGEDRQRVEDLVEAEPPG